MVPKNLLQQARKKIKIARKPLFFFDDDPDGLSSYLILKKHFNKGIGVPVKRNDDDALYERKVQEHRPDLIVTLDKPRILQDFVDMFSVPVIVVDHHPVNQLKGALYINPRIYDKEDTRPTTYWAYQLAEEDSKVQWIAAVGIVADYFLPDKNFLKTYKYKELLAKAEKPVQALYEAKIGILVRVFSSLLKGRTSEVRKLISLLERIDDPYEILEQRTNEGEKIWNHYEKLDKEYQGLLMRALQADDSGKVLVFEYPTYKTSFTSALSNEMLYRCKSKVIIVARESNGNMMLSLRSKGPKILPALEKALKHVQGHGGGHDYACGASVKKDDFQKFLKLIEAEL